MKNKLLKIVFLLTFFGLFSFAGPGKALACPNGDLACGKTVSPNITSEWNWPTRAVDGNYSLSFESTHGSNGYLTIDLGANYQIAKVRVLTSGWLLNPWGSNTTVCLSATSWFYGNNNCAYFNFLNYLSTGWAEVTFGPSIPARRYVTVRADNYQASWKEIEVYPFPPTCNIFGAGNPASICSASLYSATTTAGAGDYVTGTGIYATRQGTGDWPYQQYCNRSSCTSSITFSSAGNWDVVCNGYDSLYRCTGSPSVDYPNWADCGGGSRMVVSVSGPPAAIACNSACHTNNYYTYDGTSCSQTRYCAANQPAAVTCAACHTDNYWTYDGTSCSQTRYCAANQPAAVACAACHTDNYYTYDGSSCSQTRYCAANQPAAVACAACHTNNYYTYDGTSCSQTRYCAANAPARVECPTACGTAASNPSDGNCSTHYCAATASCNVAPTINSVTINTTPVVANNSNQYTISVTGSDGNGAADIYGLYGLINYQGETGGNYRGYLTWGLGDYWPSSQNHVSCSGEGWAVVQSGYGNSYIQLKSCSISNSGNSRTANFVVTFDPTFTTPSDNDISGYVWDSQSVANGWVNFQTNFNVCPATVPITGTITGIPSGNTSWTFAGTLQSNTINAPSGTYTVNAPVFGSYQVFAKAISGYSYTPGLTTVATPTACATVTGPTLTYAQNACPQQPDNNLKAVWHMDETSGQSAPDSSGNSYNGTATGSTIVTGKYGSGRNFSATSDVLSLSSAFPLGPNYTIGAWFNYPFPTTSGGWNTLTRGTASDHQVIVQRSNMEIGVYTSGFYGSGFITNTLSNGWHYLTAVGTGSTTTFYIDGIQKGISNVKSTSNIGYIGNYQGGGQQFGSVDEVRIWNRALTATEIGAESQQLCPTSVKVNCAPLSTCQNPRGTTIICGTGFKYRTCYDSGDSSPIDDDAQACIVQPSKIITGQIMNAPQAVSLNGNRTNTPTGGSCPNNISTTASQTSYSFTAPAMCSYNLNLQTLSGYDSSPKDYPVTIGCSDSSGPTFWYLSSAGAVSSVSTIDPGAGKISEGGYTPGYRLANYTNSFNAGNVNYSRLLNTVLKNSGLNTPTNLDADPNCSGGGTVSTPNFNIYCYDYGSFDTKLGTAISDGTAAKTMVLYPKSNAVLNQTLQTARSIATNGKIIIVFVNGNLTVNNPISIPSTYTGSGIVFVVNGNITLDPSISTFDGFYIFSGSFDDGNSVNVLTGRGSLLGTGTGNIVFNRSTTTQTLPAEEWIYQPKYLTLFAQSLATPKYTWQELPPQ